ncbi:MAG: hypothetical protein ACXW1Q_09045 [Halobacteriota archaeon]
MPELYDTRLGLAVNETAPFCNLRAARLYVPFIHHPPPILLQEYLIHRSGVAEQVSRRLGWKPNLKGDCLIRSLAAVRVSKTIVYETGDISLKAEFLKRAFWGYACRWSAVRAPAILPGHLQDVRGVLT